MQTVTVFAENFIKKENLDEAMKLFKELVEKTNKEDGCVSYSLYRDNADETHFMMHEIWESQQHLDAHFKAEHFTRIIPRIKSMAPKSGTILAGAKVL